MKKKIQPKKNTTVILLNNGSTYKKKWLFPKLSLKSENYIITNKLWNNKNQIFKKNYKK